MGERAREGEQLALAGREVAAALAHVVVVAVRQARDEAVGAHGAARRGATLPRPIGRARGVMLSATVPQKRNTSCSTRPIVAAQRREVSRACRAVDQDAAAVTS